MLAAGLPGPTGGLLRLTTADDIDDTSLRCRLLTAAYTDEQTAPDKVARLGAVDSWLFASPVPLAYARRAGVLDSPAVHIQLADGPLISALLRAGRAGTDPARASFDTFTRLEVTHALAETGVTAHRVHVREEIASPAAMASYHARLWQLGQTTVAITCLDEVARRLAASQVPAITVRPSDHAIVAALRAAIMLAEQRALAAAQLAVVLIEVPELRDDGSGRTPRLAREELRLAVHTLLAHESQQLDATVSPISEYGFLVIATRGSLAGAVGSAAPAGGPVPVGGPAPVAGVVPAGGVVPVGGPVSVGGGPPVAASGLPAAGGGLPFGGFAGGQLPFAATVARELGIALDVAVGTGRTEQAAEDAARRELRRMAPGGSARRARPVPAGYRLPASGQRPPAASRAAAGPPDLRPQLPRARQDSGRAGGAADSLSRLRSLETLARLARSLEADASPVVDAELTGRLLSVTPRTARRQLRALADEGLALPLPPRRSPHPGRPRQSYRLVVEKLDRKAAP